MKGDSVLYHINAAQAALCTEDLNTKPFKSKIVHFCCVCYNLQTSKLYSHAIKSNLSCVVFQKNHFNIVQILIN